MANKSLAFKIYTSISSLIVLILFSCFYAISMINKTQVYGHLSPQLIPDVISKDILENKEQILNMLSI